MKLSHTLTWTSAVFDDPNLVSSAGLVPVMALADAAGLRVLADQRLTVATDKGANAGLKVASLVGGVVSVAIVAVGAWLTLHGERVLGFFVARSLVGPIRRLQRGTQDVAENRLGDQIARIDRGASIESLQIEPISRASARQRAGRQRLLTREVVAQVGRVAQRKPRRAQRRHGRRQQLHRLEPRPPPRPEPDRGVQTLARDLDPVVVGRKP